jgi:hypothetical protein
MLPSAASEQVGAALEGRRSGGLWMHLTKAVGPGGMPWRCIGCREHGLDRVGRPAENRKGRPTCCCEASPGHTCLPLPLFR